MHDKDIRASLKNELPKWHGESSLVLDEIEVCGGEARVDVAVLNGSIAGYEIKSERDTLLRLKRQVAAYNRAFEYATIVTAEKYAQPAIRAVPDWWGILVATSSNDIVSLEVVREKSINPSLDPRGIALFLWRAEALAILEELGLDKGIRSKPLEDMIVRLAENVPAERLAKLVRVTMKARGDWLAAARRKRDGGKLQRLPTLSAHRRSSPTRTRRYKSRPS